MTGRSILVVSPHLDDAVLSLGGAIARWTAEDRRVVIATVFTRGPGLVEVAPALRPFADYPTRHAEDVAACAELGAAHRWLGHVERVFRAPLPPFGFFTTPAHDGFTEQAAIARSLDQLDAAPELVLAPLGIGNHVDHVEALLATLAWTARRGLGDRLRFYEDFYALSDALREVHPVTRRRPLGARALRDSPRLAEILQAIDRARGGPPIEELWPALAGAWSFEVLPIDEDRKLAAIARYGSQAEAFGGFAGIAAALRAYHTAWGGEPLWRPDAGERAIERQ